MRILFCLRRMNVMKKDNLVDGFRFIGGLHTVARQLSICTEIVRTIGNRQLPKELLGKIMTRWSEEKELKDEVYQKSKGKLTEKGKRTSAFTHYLDLCSSLNLVTNINSFYSCSRVSHILIHFLNKRENENFQLEEKLFYFFQLMFTDADGVLFIIQQLYDNPKNQIDLQRQFKDRFNERLIAKQDNANPIIKKTISEKYRVINFIWKKPEKYSEHFLIPRCEWLSTLDIIKINKQGSSTQYCLTEKGEVFFNQIHIKLNSGIIDITNNWLYEEMFSAFGKIYSNSNHKFFGDMNKEDKESTLGSSMENALNVVKSSSPFRLPLLDTFLFVCIDLFCNDNIIINISDVFSNLERELSYQSRIYSLKSEGRINEGYVIIKLVK